MGAETACAEAASWATPLKVSVNVSPIQLMNTSLTDTIIEVLHQTGLDPRRLDLEITESDVFNENTRSLEILSQLRELGIQISIDDFGTGYSSLSVATSRSIKLKSTARLSSIFRSKKTIWISSA